MNPDEQQIQAGLVRVAQAMEHGRHSEVEDLAKSLVVQSKAILGEAHHLFANSIYNLACIYEGLGKFDLAELSFRRALEVIRSTLGEDHFAYSRGLGRLASVLQENAKYDEAIPLLRHELSIAQASVGENHAEFARCLNNLGYLYVEMGTYDMAEPLLRLCALRP